MSPTTPGCAQRSEFAGTAAYGYCRRRRASGSGAYGSFCAPIAAGLPLAYTLVPANEHEYEPLLDLVDPGETVIGDQGVWGRAYNEQMVCAETELLTRARVRTAANPATAYACSPGCGLAFVESLFSKLKKNRCASNTTSPRRHAGFAQRIAQRLLALTIGILLNTISGRLARALAANDGR